MLLVIRLLFCLVVLLVALVVSARGRVGGRTTITTDTRRATGTRMRAPGGHENENVGGSLHSMAHGGFSRHASYGGTGNLFVNRLRSIGIS